MYRKAFVVGLNDWISDTASIPQTACAAGPLESAEVMVSAEMR